MIGSINHLIFYLILLILHSFSFCRRSSSIFNGSDFVCYATKSMKFGIGGDEIRIDENIVFPSDLKPCSEDTSNFSIKTAAIIENNMNSAAITVSSLSSLLTLGVVISIGLFGSIIA